MDFAIASHDIGAEDDGAALLEDVVGELDLLPETWFGTDDLVFLTVLDHQPGLGGEIFLHGPPPAIIAGVDVGAAHRVWDLPAAHHFVVENDGSRRNFRNTDGDARLNRDNKLRRLTDRVGAVTRQHDPAGHGVLPARFVRFEPPLNAVEDGIEDV